MMHPLAQQISDQYEEHLEMYLNREELLVNLLAEHLKKEKDYNDYLERRLNHVNHSA